MIHVKLNVTQSILFETVKGNMRMSQGISNTTASSRQQRLKILDQDEIEELYGVPRFSDEEREQHFTLSVIEQAALDGLKSRRGQSRRGGPVQAGSDQVK